MQTFRNFLLRRDILVFFFCIAVISGPALSTLFGYDLSQYHDTATYLGLANFDFYQNPVRKYRVIVPFAASGLNYLFGGLFSKLAPTYFTGNFSLPFSFFVVNTTLLGLCGMLIYRYCRAYGAGVLASVVGLLAFLSSRYTIYLSGLPMADSLYVLTVILSLVGIKLRDGRMIVLAIFIGPFAKESFLFIAPVIFFFSHIPKKRLVLYFLLSGILVFSFRYLLDHLTNWKEVSGVAADLHHILDIPRNIKLLLSFWGIYKVLSNIGMWLFVPLLAWYMAGGRTTIIRAKPDSYVFWFMLSVFVQTILTNAMERIFYQAMPVICVWLAFSVQEILVVRASGKNKFI